MLLLTTVIGSGIMAERLSGGNVAIALLANTAATVGGLYVLIEILGPVSGAHFNPAVSRCCRHAARCRHGRGALHPRSTLRRCARRVAGACDVRHEHPPVLHQSAQRHGPVDRRSGGHGRIDPRRASLAAGTRRGLVAHISAPPTGSPLRRRSPIRPPRSAACSVTALQASTPARFPDSYWPNSWAR